MMTPDHADAMTKDLYAEPRKPSERKCIGDPLCVIGVYESEIRDYDGIEYVTTTVLYHKKFSYVRLNIDYYSEALREYYHESVDLPKDMLLAIARDLKGDAP